MVQTARAAGFYVAGVHREKASGAREGSEGGGDDLQFHADFAA
jgi:hypothetical protein